MEQDGSIQRMSVANDGGSSGEPLMLAAAAAAGPDATSQTDVVRQSKRRRVGIEALPQQEQRNPASLVGASICRAGSLSDCWLDRTCLSCGNQIDHADELTEHATLRGVATCIACLANVRDNDAIDEGDACLVCGHGGNLVCCSNHENHSVCSECLCYILGPDALARALDDDAWCCPVCLPEVLQPLQSQYKRLLAWDPHEFDDIADSIKWPPERWEDRLETLLQELCELKGHVDNALEELEDENLERIRDGISEESDTVDAVGEFEEWHARKTTECIVLEDRLAILKGVLQEHFDLDVEELDRQIFDRLNRETATVDALRTAGAIVRPLSDEGDLEVSLDITNYTAHNADNAQAKELKAATEKILEERDRLKGLKDAPKGAEGFTIPSDKEWIYEADNPGQLKGSTCEVHHADLVNRVDTLVDVSEYEGEGMQLSGGQPISFERIREAFLRENASGFFTIQQRRNIKMYTHSDDRKSRKIKRYPVLTAKQSTRDHSNAVRQKKDMKSLATEGKPAVVGTCTVCGRNVGAAEAKRHACLPVIVCADCFGPDVSDDYCSWCKKSVTDVQTMMCGTDSNADFEGSCSRSFCKLCMDRHGLKPTYDELCELKEWKCYVCDPLPIKHLTDEYNALFDAKSDLKITGGSNNVKGELDGVTKPTENIDAPTDLYEYERTDSETEDEERDARMMDQYQFCVNSDNTTTEDPIYVHSNVAAALKPHQKEGIEFLWNTVIGSINEAEVHPDGNGRPFGAILAHCMGLGKTMQAIAFLHAAFSVKGIHGAVVVCPKNVLHTWMKEFKTWLGSDVVVRFIDSEIPLKARHAVLKKWARKRGKRGQVLVITPTLFLSLVKKPIQCPTGDGPNSKELLCEVGCQILIVDEGHNYLTNRTKRGKRKDAEDPDAGEDFKKTLQALKETKTTRRVVLTGTPLQNNLIEYYDLIDFVSKGLLGESVQEFAQLYGEVIKVGRDKDATPLKRRRARQRLHILQNKASTILQRKDYVYLKDDLPPKKEYILQLRMSPLQGNLYKVVQNTQLMRLAGGIFKWVQDTRRICNHPAAIRENHKPSELAGVLRKVVQGKADKNRECVNDESDSESDVETHGVSTDGATRPPSATLSITDTSTISVSDDDDDDDDRSMVTNSSTIPACFDQSTPHSERRGVREVREMITNELLALSPRLCDANLEDSSKCIIALELIRLAHERNEKVILFSHSLQSIDVLQYLIETSSNPNKLKPGIDEEYSRIDGDTSGEMRLAIAEKFNDPTSPLRLLLLSTRATHLGLNLIGASRVILFDIDYNPAYERQAIFRTYRYGQLNPVVVYYLLGGPTERVLHKKHIDKLQLFNTVVDIENPERHFTADDWDHSQYELQLGDVMACTNENATSAATDAVVTVEKEDPVLAKLLASKSMSDRVIRCVDHESFMADAQEDDLNEKEIDEAFAEYHDEVEQRRSGRIQKRQRNSVASRHLIQITSCGMFEQQMIPQKLIHYRKKPLAKRHLDRDRRFQQETAVTRFQVIVWGSNHRETPRHKFCANTCWKFVNLIPIIQKQDSNLETTPPERDDKLSILHFEEDDGLRARLYRPSDSTTFQTMVDEQLVSSDGILYVMFETE